MTREPKEKREKCVQLFSHKIDENLMTGNNGIMRVYICVGIYVNISDKIINVTYNVTQTVSIVGNRKMKK